MAVASDSYGDAAGVARLVPMHTNEAGVFDETSQPTIETVEAWIDDLSDTVNVILEDYGYSVPATNRLATWLKTFVQQEVAAQIRSIYKQTRRGPSDEEESEARDLLTNIGKVNEYLDARTVGDRFKAGSKTVTRADAYSSDLNTTETS